MAGPRISRRAGQTRMAPGSIPSVIIYVMLDVESLTGVIEAVMVAAGVFPSVPLSAVACDLRVLLICVGVAVADPLHLSATADGSGT